jgi:hypothetical protein
MQVVPLEAFRGKVPFAVVGVQDAAIAQAVAEALGL